MRLPLRLPEYRLYQKWLAAAVIAIVCAGLGVALWTPAKVLGAVGMLDHVFYDSLYRLRPIESQQDAPIVIVAVNDQSIDRMQKGNKIGWPWPRDFWGKMISYLDQEAGAKAIVFDLLFDGSSVRNHPGDDDDEKFATAVNSAQKPVILAARVNPDGTTTEIIPPIDPKIIGAVNISDDASNRTYLPVVKGHESLALQVMKQINRVPPAWAQGNSPFYLRYYGPHAKGAGPPVTFKYVEATSVLDAATGKLDVLKQLNINAGTFKDKIVFVAAITAGTFDLKSSPLSSYYPGVEIHATALQNMLTGERVTPVGVMPRLLTLLFACFVSAVGTVIPPRVPAKLVGGVAGIAIVLMVTAFLFLSKDVRWMPPAAALIATMLSAFVGLSYSYLTELRQRRFILKAFTQYVSKEVADQITKDPRKLSLQGERRVMTVMFTDLENFTNLSEALEVERLANMLNFYFGEMSGVIKEQQNGTLDKYIGDSIMSFWNAPLDQDDHACRACKSALEMCRRENLLQAELIKLAGGPVHSRIGINTGPMSVGNMGSNHKLNYTVLGDSVNLASRLEGANKMYGTRIMLSESTAEIVKDQFLLRKLDVLRVKGKLKPMGVYELIGERNGSEFPAYIPRYEGALEHYQQGQFDTALELLTALKKDFPQDGPTDTLLARVLELRDNPPGPNWDGVFVAKTK